MFVARTATSPALRREGHVCGFVARKVTVTIAVGDGALEVLQDPACNSDINMALLAEGGILALDDGDKADRPRPPQHFAFCA